MEMLRINVVHASLPRNCSSLIAVCFVLVFLSNAKYWEFFPFMFVEGMYIYTWIGMHVGIHTCVAGDWFGKSSSTLFMEASSLTVSQNSHIWLIMLARLLWRSSHSETGITAGPPQPTVFAWVPGTWALIPMLCHKCVTSTTSPVGSQNILAW